MGVHGTRPVVATFASAVAVTMVAALLGVPTATAESGALAGSQALPPTYGVTVLPDPPDTFPGFQGERLNEFGHVAGWADSPSRAFVFRGGVLTELPHLTAEPSSANDINDAGVVVGGSTFDATSGHAVRWVNGSVQDLGTLEAGGRSEATAVNDLGHVTGTASVSGGSVVHAFIWTPTTGMRDITPEHGGELRSATGINSSDQVVGHRSIANTNRAYRITSGVLQDLGTADGFAHSFASDINDSGQVAGFVTSATGNSERLARFTDGIGWEILGGVGETNLAAAINNDGAVVGSGVPEGGPITAVVFFDGLGLFDLDALVPGTEWNLLRGHDINDAGQIIVSAANTITGGIRNLLLTPLTQLPAGTHVQDITITFQPARRGDVRAVARVGIVDHDGQPVSDGLVEGDWTRADLPFATGKGRTDATGTAVITKRLRKPAPGTQIGFCVRNVTHSDLPYQRDFNVETCDEALTP